MSKLLVVTCTRAKTEQEFQQRPIYRSLQKQHDSNSPNVDFHIFRDNTRSLADCYNEILRDPKHLNKTVLFVHDDVELDDMFLYEKLVHSPYSITGLAGAKSFNKQSAKLAWHLCAPREDYVGEVAHVGPDKQVWTTVFGKTTSRALVIDGLFVACKVQDLIQQGLDFDLRYGFHHYDISFCLRAHEKKVTCGVLPIRVIHHGLGDSMNTPEWNESNDRFKQDYCQ